jgi:DNA-binding response OmpR family regulator
VVEDEELMLDLVASVLEQKGYRVLLARDGEEAMKIHQANIGRIDLVLSDIGLPKLDGWESCQQMKQADPTMRIILASGYLEPELKSEIMKVGSIGLIRKPYSPLEILNNIRKALDEKNSQGNAGAF